jgi:hypothetical protein
MAFAKKVSSGLIRPLRYNDKNGTFVIVRSIKRDDGTWDNSPPEDITDSFRAVFDLKNVGACWLNLVKGQPPQVEGLVPMGQRLGKRPAPKGWWEAFYLLCKLDDSFEDGACIREVLSVTDALRDAFSEVHSAYEAESKRRSGQLPILIVAGKNEVEAWNGPVFQPIFKIDGWVPRPAELPDVPPHREDFAPATEKRGDNNEVAEAAGSAARAASGGGYSGGFGSGGARRQPGNQDDMSDEIPFRVPSLECNRDNKPPL